MTRIMLVDDHPTYREGLGFLLTAQLGYEVVGLAANASEARLMIEDKKPNLVIMDLSLGANNGLELLKDFTSVYTDIRFVILSMHDEFIYAERALVAGASAYIQKYESTATVLEAIRTVSKGKRWFSPEVKERFLQNLFVERNEMGLPGLSKLSDRELEVFNWVGKGLGATRIANILGLSVKTIDTHKEHLKHKLRCKDTQELRIKATEWYSQELVKK